MYRQSLISLYYLDICVLTLINVVCGFLTFSLYSFGIASKRIYKHNFFIEIGLVKLKKDDKHHPFFVAFFHYNNLSIFPFFLLS